MPTTAPGPPRDLTCAAPSAPTSRGVGDAPFLDDAVFSRSSLHTRLPDDAPPGADDASAAYVGRRTAGVDLVDEGVVLLEVRTDHTTSDGEPQLDEVAGSDVRLSRRNEVGIVEWDQRLGSGWTSEGTDGQLRVVDDQVVAVWARYDGPHPYRYGSQEPKDVALVRTSTDLGGRAPSEVVLDVALPTQVQRWSTAIGADGSVSVATDEGDTARIRRFDADGRLRWTRDLTSGPDGSLVQVQTSASGLTVASAGAGTEAWDEAGTTRWRSVSPVTRIVPVEVVSGADAGATPDVLLVAGPDHRADVVCTVDATGSVVSAVAYGQPEPVRAWWQDGTTTLYFHESGLGTLDGLVTQGPRPAQTSTLVLGTTGDVLPTYGTVVDDVHRTDGGELVVVGSRVAEPPDQPGDAEVWRFVLRLPSPAGEGDIGDIPATG